MRALRKLLWHSEANLVDLSSEENARLLNQPERRVLVRSTPALGSTSRFQQRPEILIETVVDSFAVPRFSLIPRHWVEAEGEERSGDA
jgi:hypothetical protein